MLIQTPNNFASFYSCSFCGISAQILLPMTDEYGSFLYNEEGTQLLYNDEPNASAEIGEHIQAEHADLLV
jgi:hypothetical protein